MSGAVPPLAARPLGRAAGVPRPVCPRCGWYARGDPAPAPQRAPLRAGVGRCGGGGGASPGGVPFAVVRRLRSGAPEPLLPALQAVCRGPPSTWCGRRCGGVGAQHCPLGLHALWGLRAVGMVGGRPRGGWPATVVRGVWCEALSLPQPPVLWGGQPAFCDPCVPVWSLRAWGPSIGSKARALAGRRSSLWGWRKGVPGGGAFHRCGGRLRSGAPPPPTARSPGGLSESATHVLWARGCGCGGPALSPWLACPVRAACPGGCGGPSPREVACHRCEGRLVSGAVPPPAARLLGGQPGFRDPCVPGAVVAGVGTQHRPHSAHSYGPALRTVGVAEGRPRGGCRSPL